MKKKRKKVVTIGGGTGSLVLLSGLKKYDIDLSAIVSMADDGGSTGILRDELGVLPPGDVRQCLVALSESPQIMRDLLNYRFEEGGLKGHSFGNLFLSALEKISGSFSKGVVEAMKILDTQGQVIPITNDKAHLCMKLANGKVLEGEHEIYTSTINAKVEKIFYKPEIKVNKDAVRAILEADAVVIGPGNFYATLLPNLIIKGISQAIEKSKAKVVYNCNLTNKKGQTEGFKADDYINAVEKYIGGGRIDYVIINNKKPPQKIIEKYEKQEGKNILIEFDFARKEKRSYKIIQSDLSSRKEASCSKSDSLCRFRSFIRHDSDRLAKAIMSILN